MKKLTLICASVLLMLGFTVTAQAVTLSNEDQGVTASVEAQAQMLKKLGLFNGTEKGFELERAMTRDESAAMLVRYLGAEQKVLAGAWKHPFTDVEPWADQYVGWLYQSGLTKGVSKSRYGALDRVTADQFCIFLSRAASGQDEYNADLATTDETKACDKTGFLRGDAVVLAVRALSHQYTQYENWISMAQFMIDHEMFTVDAFKAAAWDVLPREYRAAQARTDTLGTEGYALSCVIAGVTVLRDEAVTDIAMVSGDAEAAQIYGSITADKKMTLYRIDKETLALTQLASYPDRLLSFLCSVGGTDYLTVQDIENNGIVIAIKGDTVRTLDVELHGSWNIPCYPLRAGAAFAVDGGICIAGADGEHILKTEADEKLFTVIGDLIITQQQSEAQSVIRSRSMNTGAVIDSYTVRNAMDMAQFGDRMSSEDGKRYVIESYMPKLMVGSAPYLWGTAGLYKTEGDHLTQITARPVLDYAFDAADGSYVLATHRPEKRVEYYAQAVSFLAGDMLVRLNADGTETVLLEDRAEYKLLIDKVKQAANGRVVFTHLIATEPRRMGSFTMVLENGKIRVTEATSDISFIWGENALLDEQKRLDDLGIGVNS